MLTNFTPHIGKNVIETLTMGMYDDSRYIYREYIQNAADQIDVAVEEEILKSKDEGQILITIDSDSREITIEDNATGIRSNEVLNFLGDVANSKKDLNQRKGFRGIGRLGGLGYCETLVFETSYKGEIEKNILSLDAKLLRIIIADRKDNQDAAAVISAITSIENVSEEKDKHYFKVRLVNVLNDSLLNIEYVSQYLSVVAPLPFKSDFKFSEDIKIAFKKDNFVFDEYIVKLNNEQIFKAYKNDFIDGDDNTPLIGVDFFKVFDSTEIFALGWIGYRNFSNRKLEPENVERGIRLKKNNITIGDENTLNRFFKQQRTNLRFIGEIHILTPNLIPNARRDYFNDNKSCQEFEQQLSKIFQDRDWENNIAHTASDLYNRVKEIEIYKKNKDDLESQKITFDDPAKEKRYLDKLEIEKVRAEKASKKLVSISNKAYKDNNIKKLYEHFIGDKDLAFDPNINIPVIKYDPPTFRKLNDDQVKTVIEIFSIIENVLSASDADNLKQRILEKFN